jgi:hypothetical protein
MVRETCVGVAQGGGNSKLTFPLPPFLRFFCDRTVNTSEYMYHWPFHETRLIIQSLTCYSDLLEVKPTASPSEIKKAFRMK